MTSKAGPRKPIASQFSKASTRGALPLRWHLLLLVAGALLPIVLFTVAIIHRLTSEEQATAERRLLLAARSLTESVEREVSGTVRTLQTLAISEQLDRDNLQSFYTEAHRVAQTQSGWLTVILLTPDGRQLLNTRLPYGAKLPLANEPESLHYVVESQQPTLGYLVRGKINQEWAFPVRVPVVRGGKLRYVLTAVIAPKALAGLVQNPISTDREWTRTIVDGHGVVVARTRDPERFIGRQGTPSFLQRIASASEGISRETTLEGKQVYLAFSRTSFSGWTTAVTVPVAVIQEPTRQAMLLVVGSGVLLLLASGLGTLLLARRISLEIAAAALAAKALAEGEHPVSPVSSIQEVNLLSEALEFSAELLAQRAQERDENLMQAEAARAEAEVASRLKDEFLITVSHELRTPLNAIFGWARLLRVGQLSAEKVQYAIAVIERNAKAQAQLVDDLLDTSRIMTGKLHIETQFVNFAAVVASAVDSMRPAAEAKSIELNLKIATDAAAVMGDQNRLQQVIWNLLSNAVKFTLPGGCIDVALQCADTLVEVVVRDTGMGIRTDFLPYVFDRFRQADGSTTREFGGLGLGLAIVQHLVELHGGTVTVDSEGEGKGATFTVRLPLALRSENYSQLKAALTADTALGSSKPKLQGVRVLVLDDEPDARELVMSMLTQQGADVKTCASVGEALNAVMSWQPAVILSDIGMPQEDGYEFIRKVRQWESEAGGTIPAAALTAFTRPEDRIKVLAAGYQMHLSKPIDPVELCTVVVNLVGSNPSGSNPSGSDSSGSDSPRDPSES